MWFVEVLRKSHDQVQKRDCTVCIISRELLAIVHWRITVTAARRGLIVIVSLRPIAIRGVYISARGDLLNGIN